MSNPNLKRHFGNLNAPPTHLVQNASGTFLSTDPSLDDGGERAYAELQESLAKKPLLLPPEDSIQLWEKAKLDPSSLTDDDRLLILGRWPLDKFNEQCQKLCGGKTLDEILEKAVNSPQDLTSSDTTVIIHGVGQGLSKDPGLDLFKWPSHLRDLFLLAKSVAETERDRTAMQNARGARSRAIKAKSSARHELSEDDRKNIVWSNRTEWTSKLDPNQEWGFALYRTCFNDDDGWEKFKFKLESATKTAFAFVNDSEEISKRWRIHYVEDKELERASIERLAA